MSDKLNFHTLKGYELQENKVITYAMEDYLEMICRVSKTKGYVRIIELADNLNVKASSVSKMVSQLKACGLVSFEKYGYIEATPTGIELGNYLIYRHKVLHDFLCLVNSSENELEQVEKIEHYMNKQTIENIENLYNKIIEKT